MGLSMSGGRYGRTAKVASAGRILVPLNPTACASRFVPLQALTHRSCHFFRSATLAAFTQLRILLWLDNTRDRSHAHLMPAYAEVVSLIQLMGRLALFILSRLLFAC